VTSDTGKEGERDELVARRERLLAMYRAATEAGQWERVNQIESLLYEVDGRLADLLRGERRKGDRRKQ
jgi:hypothetical protein